MGSKLHFKAKIISLPYPIEMQFLILVSGRSHDLILKYFLIPQLMHGTGEFSKVSARNQVDFSKNLDRPQRHLNSVLDFRWRIGWFQCSCSLTLDCNGTISVATPVAAYVDGNAKSPDLCKFEKLKIWEIDYVFNLIIKGITICFISIVPLYHRTIVRQSYETFYDLLIFQPI